MKKNFLKKILRSMAAVLMLLSFILVTAGNSLAAEILSEDFEGTFPPVGWSVAEDDPTYSYVVWHRSDVAPNYGVGSYPPMSGYYAYAESYPAYCGYSYDTSLISPYFSTVGMNSVTVEFDFQYWVYSSEFLALDYRIGADPWVTLETLPSIGGYIAQTRVVDISVTKGNQMVQLRWRYCNLGSGCDWWAGIDNVKVMDTTPVPIPTLNEWGMIIFTILTGMASVYYLRRQRRT